MAALTAALLAGCSETRQTAARESGERVEATVLTYRTRSSTRQKVYVNKVIVRGSQVRVGGELDRWRLYDLEKEAVTLVDETTRSYETIPLATLVRRRDRIVSQPLPQTLPLAKISAAPSREVAGHAASCRQITMGSYARQLCTTGALEVPPALFRAVQATEELAAASAPAMREVVAELSKVEGVTVYDRAETRYGEKSMVVERELIKVEKTTVPAEWVRLPAGFTDRTPATAPAADRPSAS